MQPGWLRATLRERDLPAVYDRSGYVVGYERAAFP